ncbi:class I SAM-dependent RNA methyltransferase [Cognatishimia sp. SS12]|uniref:THUMP domain-containing class I SAM-dependent RNA methyltransferase n=1 Tax=Cognatishimia sp. SS12 TaxID=2979465 RepID=UPI00232B0B69|nr:class I SAM-dependent RNA methyltransferase [Cognatishimia sp. SS12]MDC0738449.1 class I SAM-dependent RNA methyltransferase [Cognatishimia sp. SS12]
MSDIKSFPIFLACPPGLEPVLCAEAQELGWGAAQAVPGGVEFEGTWRDIWRANLELRGATRVLVRIGSFMAFHPAQLDKRARKFPWGDVLRPDVPVRVEVVSKRSKIYHAGAAKQRIERAISEELGAPLSAEAAVALKVRIDDNVVTISVDTSGESLHKRGHKAAVGKAPMRETLAALFLRSCGYHGDEPVLDPMCGSGTFVIEAAEMALGLQAGRARHFAFEHLASFDAAAFETLRRAGGTESAQRFFGSDRNTGAVQNASDNAARAQVDGVTSFHHAAISDLKRPEGQAGLVIVNPPYGARIGNKKLLFGLYGALGQKLKEEFSGWRVGIITSDSALARATGLPNLTNGAPIPHGGLKVRLFQAGPL